MKNKYLPRVIFSLLLLSLLNLNAQKKNDTYVLQIDESGKLVSLLPEILENGSSIKIMRTTQNVSNQSKEVFLHYKKLLTAIHDPDFKNATGLTVTHTLAVAIQKELASKLLGWKINAPELLTDDEIATFNKMADKGKSLNLFPEIDMIGQAQEKVSVSYYYRDGTKEVKIVNTGTIFKIEKVGLLRMEVQVELPNIFKGIDDYFLTDSRNMFAVAGELSKEREAFRKKYPAGTVITDEIKNEVDLKLQAHLPALEKLFTYFTWRRIGKISSKKELYEAEKKIIETNLTTEARNLQTLVRNYRADSLKQLSLTNASTNYKPANCTDFTCLDDLHKKIISAMEADIAAIQISQEKTKELKKNLTELTKQFASEESNMFEVEVLNRIKMFVSSDETQQHMTHYNASEDFAFWGDNYLRAINEKEDMYILVHNLSKSQQLRLTEKITAITNDISTGEQEVKGGGAAGINANLEKLFDAFFAIGIDEIINSAKQFKNVSKIPFKSSQPKWETKVLHTKPSSEQVPFKVEYNFTLLKKDGSDSVKVFPADLSYRVNKIYHVRFKAGLYYSMLRQDKFTITNNQITQRSSNEYGIDACYGMQWFPGGIDIRSNKWLAKSYGTCPFFLYFGTGITKNPLNNLLVGAGLELHSGFALMAGVHVGKSEKIINNNGNLSVNDKSYKGNLYVSAAFDLAIFNALFNYKNIENPFKAN